MGFHGTKTLLNHDVSIDTKSTMTWVQKIEDISFYKESDFFEIREPTKKICSYFRDKIEYCLPSSKFWVIDNNRLNLFNYLPNKVELNSFEEVLDYLSDNTKKIYFIKLTCSGGNLYSIYCYEIDNVPNIRNQKLEEILK